MLVCALAPNDPLAKKILVKLALGFSYIPRPNRIRIKSTCSVVIANLEIFLVYLLPPRKEDCSIIVIFFAILMHTYLKFVLITTVFHSFNYFIKETIFTERKSVAYYLKNRKAGRSSY